MAQWLISYRLRRLFRKPSGELGLSRETADRMELTTDHPAVFLARSAAAVKTFTDPGNGPPNHTAACDRIEVIHSAIGVHDDVLTVDQQQVLEEGYTESAELASNDPNLAISQVVADENRLIASLSLLDKLDRNMEAGGARIAAQQRRISAMALRGLDVNLANTALDRMLQVQALFEKTRAAIEKHLRDAA